MGDDSSVEERRKYFDEVDADHSDGVDFEEFLEVSYQITNLIVVSFIL